MDPAKIELLFGRVPTWADPDHPDDRAELLSEQRLGGEADQRGAALRPAVHETVATQIADEDPPEVWATARRLLGMGLDRRHVVHNLVLALLGEIRAGLREERAFDVGAYVKALDRLPLPTEEEIEDALLAIVRERQPIAAGELESLAMARLGMSEDEEPYETLVDRVSDRAMGPDGPLEMLAPDRVVEPASVFAGIVLTHRLTEAERETELLPLVVDLVAFARANGPLRTARGEELRPVFTPADHPAWGGPPGWLSRFQVGALLAVRMNGATVTIEVLADDPALDPALVGRVRAAYDTEVAEPWLPIAAEDLLLGVLVEDRSAFSTPRPPLSELCRSAGLEIREGALAHEESVWESGRRLRRVSRVMQRTRDEDEREAVFRVLDAFDQRDPDAAPLRAAVADLRDPAVLEVALDEMLGLDDDPGRVEATGAFAERLLDAARRPAEIAVARLVAAVVAERRCDPLAGKAHLDLAVEADRDWGPAVDRLAWYLSDRGEAAEAARLWRRLGVGPDENDDLREVEGFEAQPGPKLGRNDPCWCGSGRKFKVCHLDRPVAASLPDRVGWLCRKATAYLERRGGAVPLDVQSLALARAGGEAGGQALARAMGDPFVIDIALHELGWFGRFLAERGALLPEDEALLAASWELVDRSVYEIVRVDPGVGVEARDLRTAEILQVRERTGSRRAGPGMLICARAVPDGETHQFIGGVFTVPPGTEGDLLDLLDEKDAYELIEYLAALERPPTLQTREGEPLVACTAVLEVPDEEAARMALDRLYRADEPGTWVESHALEGGDRVVRATVRLQGKELKIETMSEPRLERVLADLLGEVEGAELLSDERRPFDPRRPPKDLPPSAPPPLDDPRIREALEDWLDRHEERWCDEPVPALGGLTPREAAADPTRREALRRLLASYGDEGGMGPEGTFTLRPSRLRRLLGLEE